MKCVADLLYLERRACPRQIPLTEMWLANVKYRNMSLPFRRTLNVQMRENQATARC